MAKSVLPVYNAFNRELHSEVPVETFEDLELKIKRSVKAFQQRKSWLKVHERIDILYRLAILVSREKNTFARLIAIEGGKPLTDAMVETTRAIDGIRSAAE